MAETEGEIKVWLSRTGYFNHYAIVTCKSISEIGKRLKLYLPRSGSAVKTSSFSAEPTSSIRARREPQALRSATPARRPPPRPKTTRPTTGGAVLRPARVSPPLSNSTMRAQQVQSAPPFHFHFALELQTPRCYSSTTFV